ncbi:glycosyltransferase family 2 protein [Helicobacter cinaedi]|uniref:glycosyltransferase family 2 protein n=1 Tax=Helicobacter cinaedi TaxID=213 RepID=UPI0013158EC6|nr:glycosyltransferase family A protein [Helicobacter cinaedi]
MKDQSQTHRVGIVVPIYNVEQYLRECLDSILAQSYQNFEVVLVNDGSTDTSLNIAKEYVLKDKRFVLIDKENGGLSNARNTGIYWFQSRFQAEILTGGGGMIFYKPINARIFTLSRIKIESPHHRKLIGFVFWIPMIYGGILFYKSVWHTQKGLM